MISLKPVLCSNAPNHPGTPCRLRSNVQQAAWKDIRHRAMLQALLPPPPRAPLTQGETAAQRSAAADGAAPMDMPPGAERPRGHEPRGRTPPVCAGSALPGDTQECFPALAEVCPGAPPLAASWLMRDAGNTPYVTSRIRPAPANEVYSCPKPRRGRGLPPSGEKEKCHADRSPIMDERRPRTCLPPGAPFRQARHARRTPEAVPTV